MDYRDPDWVADKLGIDKNTVYRFLQDGTLPALQLGRKWLISERRLEQWLEGETDRQTRGRRDSVQSAERLVRRLDQFTAAARAAVKFAHAEARRLAHEQFDQGHLLLGLMADQHSAVATALSRLQITPQLVNSVLQVRLPTGVQPPPRRLSRTPETKRAMRLAARLAARESNGQALQPITSDHLLTGILLARRGLGHEILADANITRQRLRQELREAHQSTNKGDSHDHK